MAMTTTWGNPLIIQQFANQDGAATGTVTSTLTRPVIVSDCMAFVRTASGDAGSKTTISVANGAAAITTTALVQTTANTALEVMRAVDLSNANWSVSTGGTIVSTIGVDAAAGTAGTAMVNITCMAGSD